jgi:hypothetical protein
VALEVGSVFNWSLSKFPQMILNWRSSQRLLQFINVQGLDLDLLHFYFLLDILNFLLFDQCNERSHHWDFFPLILVKLVKFLCA